MRGAGTFYMPVLCPSLTVAHLFRVLGVREAVGGSPLEGLEQFSLGSLPQRGSREGSGMGGDRPWKLRARGLRATPAGLRWTLGNCSLELSWKSSSMEMYGASISKSRVSESCKRQEGVYSRTHGLGVLG